MNGTIRRFYDGDLQNFLGSVCKNYGADAGQGMAVYLPVDHDRVNHIRMSSRIDGGRMNLLVCVTAAGGCAVKFSFIVQYMPVIIDGEEDLRILFDEQFLASLCFPDVDSGLPVVSKTVDTLTVMLTRLNSKMCVLAKAVKGKMGDMLRTHKENTFGIDFSGVWTHMSDLLADDRLDMKDVKTFTVTSTNGEYRVRKAWLSVDWNIFYDPTPKHVRLVRMDYDGDDEYLMKVAESEYLMRRLDSL